MEQDREDIRKRFGKRLRELRKKAGFSQEGFADHCDFDRSYVGQVERGEKNVSLLNIERFASSLDMTLPELFENM
jgi:transcriptional regulator with XRE-family HTH domain